MSQCPTHEQLQAFATDHSTPNERVEIDGHLRNCSTCREAFERLTAQMATADWQQKAQLADELADGQIPIELRRHPRYEVTAVLGRGGMGAVYKAEHRLLQRPVVLKIIRPDIISKDGVIERFERESRLAARMSHPNVVGVYEAESLSSTQMLVMEFVEGVTLSQLISHRGLLPVAEACELIRQAAIGLEYIYAQGMVHRDIKPANLIVSTSGQVKILDLGLATFRSRASSDRGELTSEGQFVGTVDYAAPEQWESSRDVDIRADVYSLGCTFYFLLAGETPFPQSKYSTLLQKMWAHSQAPLPPIRAIRPDLPESIEHILNRMLAKNRDERYGHPSEIAEALAPFTQDCNLTEFVTTTRRTTTSKLDLSLVSSTPTVRGKSTAAATPSPTATEPSLPRPRRRWIEVGVGVLMALALVWSLWPKRDGDPNPMIATTVPPIASGEPIKVGILHSRTGTMSMSERPVIDATLIAIEELNAKGGVLGRPIEAIVEDGKSDEVVFATKAEQLISKDKVSTVFGCWTSASRKTVLPIFEKHNHLLIYPVQYEGLEQSPNIIYTGSAPNQQIIPAVKWCASVLKKKRLFLIGSDYVFPRTAHAIIRDQAKQLGAEIVGEEYVLLGSSDVQPAIQKILASQPDAILNCINGDTNIAFFRGLRAAGVTSKLIPTISFSISEEELGHINSADVVDDYAACNYFQSVDRQQNHDFVARFQKKHGKHRIISDPMEAAYVGVHLWADAVRQANSTDPKAIRDAITHQSFDGPSGLVKVDETTRHVTKVVRIGKITTDNHFEIVYDSRTAIAPQPYPNTRSRSDWDQFLLDLNLGWGGKWSAPAIPPMVNPEQRPSR